MTVPGGPSGPRASFGERLIAILIDGLILGVVQLTLGRLAFFGSVTSFIIAIGYFVYLEGSPSGQTVGKRAMSIRVVHMTTGASIEYSGAIIRYLGRIVSSIACLIGYFWMLWDPEKQTWHDKFASSVVVPTSAYPVDNWPG